MNQIKFPNHIQLQETDIQISERFNILGVTFSCDLKVQNHITNTVKKCNSMMYMLKIMKNHGLGEESLQDIFMAMVMSRLLYAVCSWYWLAMENDKKHMEKIVKRAKKLGYYKENCSLNNIIENRVDILFETVKSPQHMLHELLPPGINDRYELRKSAHGYQLLAINSIHDMRNFILHQLYKSI